MTELDTVKRAKLYIDQLANGINPFDGTVIPEGEIIHNVWLSRCFFYISRILQQVVDNGGTVTPGEPKKRIPLSIPHQKREQFAYSGTPISASEIARRVNQLAGDERMKKLTYSGIVSWLMDIGLLTRVSASDGRLTVRPTSLGEENGISVVQRMGANGSYRVVVYDLKAQHFLLDNLDAVIDRENAELNGVQDERLSIIAGNVLTDDALADQLAAEPVDLILANIVADVLIGMAPLFVRCLKPGGDLIISGIITERAEEVLSVMREYGFAVLDQQEENGWCAARLSH